MTYRSASVTSCVHVLTSFSGGFYSSAGSKGKQETMPDSPTDRLLWSTWRCTVSLTPFTQQTGWTDSIVPGLISDRRSKHEGGGQTLIQDQIELVFTKLQVENVHLQPRHPFSSDMLLLHLLNESGRVLHRLSIGLPRTLKLSSRGTDIEVDDIVPSRVVHLKS